MDLREIDQIKGAEQEAVALIETARHHMKLAIEEAKREGDNSISIRLSDAESRLRNERDTEEKLLKSEIIAVIEKAENEAAILRSMGEKNIDLAVLRLVRMITGEEDVLSRTNE